MLKKISVIIASIVLLLSLFLFNRVPIVDNANEYEVCLKNYSSTDWIQTVSENEFKFVLGVKGESCTLYADDFCLEVFLSKMSAKVIFSENIENVVCYYGYSPKVKYLESVNGELINVHIAVSQSYVKIGFPIIYGSF